MTSIVKAQKFEDVPFEDVVRHLSEVYIEGTHNPKSCEICKKAMEILDMYNFLSFKKSWDYDE